MVISAAVERYVATAPQTTKGNLEAYFAKYAIDQTQVVEAVRRQSRAEADAFFVSSIVRGLGGSTSDIDIVLEFGGAEAATTMSTMMFVGERRVGFKYVTVNGLRRAIAELEALGNKSQVTAVVSGWDKTHDISWVDLERIINGWSYKTGMAHLDALPTFCTISCKYFARDALFFARLAVLADLAGTGRASLAYGWGATLAMMDQVMAACGRVQATRKWTLERWRRFCAEIVPEARDCIAAVEAAYAALSGPEVNQARSAMILRHVERVLALLEPELLGHHSAFRTNYPEHNKCYFGSARALHDSRQIIVTSADILDLAVRPWAELTAIDSTAARSLVTLAQAGLVSADPELAI